MSNAVSTLTSLDTIASKIQIELSHTRRQSTNNLLNQVNKDAKIQGLLRNNAFCRKIISLLSLMKSYSNEDDQSKALDIILASPIYERLEKEGKSNSSDYTDRLVKQLLKWYKEEFFKWVDKPECPKCGNTEQDKIQRVWGGRPHLKEHFEGQATIVEQYQCQKCKNIIEFPRYNKASKLLETRRGRCGEWNNCFILLMKSLGLKVRYVWNMEDHVWCEYFSDNLQRWVHIDSCENAFDNPLLYSKGWGKKMSYIFAISDHYIVDVTEKYVEHGSKNVIPRDKIDEDDLKMVLAALNLSLLSQIDDDKTLLEVSSNMILDHNTMKNNSILPVKIQDCIPPRQSGSAEWKNERGENGKD